MILLGKERRTWTLRRHVGRPEPAGHSCSHLTGLCVGVLILSLERGGRDRNERNSALEFRQGRMVYRTLIKYSYQFHPKFQSVHKISMARCKKYVTPLLTHWSYVFLALNHRCVVMRCSISEWRRHMTISLCTGDRVNAHYERITSWFGAWYWIHDRLETHFATHSSGQCAKHRAKIHPSKRIGTSRAVPHTDRHCKPIKTESTQCNAVQVRG